MYCESSLSSMLSNDAIEQLKRLVRVNRDAAAGFLTAAKDIHNSELDTLFTGYAKQHEKFRKEIQTEIQHDEPGEGTDRESGGGGLHRRWADLKVALSGHSTHAVLAACEDEMQSVEAAYADAGTLGFTGRVGAMLSKQELQVKETHKHLCRLLGEVKDGVEFRANE